MRRWVPYVLCGVLVVVSLGAAGLSAASTSRPPGALGGKLVTAGTLPAGWKVLSPAALQDTAVGLHGVCVAQYESILGPTYAVVAVQRTTDGPGAGVSEAVSWTGLGGSTAAHRALVGLLRCIDQATVASGRNPLDAIYAGKNPAPSLGVRGVYASVKLAGGGLGAKPSYQLNYFVVRDGVSGWLLAIVPPGEPLGPYVAMVRDAAQKL